MLYYSCDKNNLYFSSEIPALLPLVGSKPVINVNTSLKYLIEGSYGNTEETFFENILQLMPGCYAKIDLDKPFFIRPVKWFNPSISLSKKT